MSMVSWSFKQVLNIDNLRLVWLKGTITIIFHGHVDWEWNCGSWSRCALHTIRPLFLFSCDGWITAIQCKAEIYIYFFWCDCELLEMILCTIDCFHESARAVVPKHFFLHKKISVSTSAMCWCLSFLNQKEQFNIEVIVSSSTITCCTNSRALFLWKADLPE